MAASREGSRTMRSSVLRAVVWISALAALWGCTERSAGLSPADKERLREHVSTERPTPEHALDVQFANGLSLIGYDLEPDTVVEGQPFTITWHWHAKQGIDDGWQLFTHVADASGENRLNQDGVGVVRELYPPGRWKAGEYIRDVQRVTLEGWNSPRAVFYLGLWKGAHRMEVRRGDDDGDNRVRAASITLGSGPTAAAGDTREPARVEPPPSLNAARATAPITVDGKLDEADWVSAGRTARFVNTVDGSNAELRAEARVLWDDDNLYVAFEVADDFVQNTIATRDGHLWEQDAVEIMVDPDGDGRNYFEMQVSPTGQVFDTRYDTRRQPQPIGHVAWNSGLRAKVDVRGTANDDEADQGYTAEIAIPWRAFRAGEPAAAKPEPGQSWKLNFYVMDTRPGDQGQRSAGWSPTHERDFHVPSRFGQVTFEPARPQLAAAAEAAPTAPEAAQPTGQAAPTLVAPTVQLRPNAAKAIQRAMVQNRPGARLTPRALPQQ